MLSNFLFSARKYLEYRWKSVSANQIHSPFVFSLYNEVLHHPYLFYAFEAVESERISLLKNQQTIVYHDVGAHKRSVKTTVAELAYKSLMPGDAGQLLFQLAAWLSAKTVIELGTCLGISTAYLALASAGRVSTFEGIRPIGQVAELVWKNLDISSIDLIFGKIEDTLPVFLAGLQGKIDLAVIDANHTYEATMKNYEALRPHFHNDGCLVLDDIYWSPGMAQAWEEIKKKPEVTVTVDIFRMGLVFFRKESRKEDFVIRW